MTKHLYLVILLTFVTGLATGVYGYFMTQHEVTVEDAGSGGQASDASGYEILATVYGGCERVGCASFRLHEDGSYTYLSPDGVHSYARFEDEISPRQRELLAELLMSAPLSRIEKSAFSGVCPITYDGIAYRFDIRLETKQYSLDTCMQDLGREELFIELIKYFAIMEVTHLTP
jgi:hypothetical protein